jgi:hypothetical protein
MKVCISCEADVAGKKAFPVRDDRVIKVVREAKKLLRIAKMNELYVCESCLPKHRERRQKFERNMLFAIVLGALIIVVMLAMTVLSGTLNLWAVVTSIIMGAFVMLLPVLFSYAPAVELPPGTGQPPAPGPRLPFQQPSPAVKKKPARRKR